MKGDANTRVAFSVSKDSGSVAMFAAEPSAMCKISCVILTPRRSLIGRLITGARCRRTMRTFIRGVRAVARVREASDSIRGRKVFVNGCIMGPLANGGIPL